MERVIRCRVAAHTAAEPEDASRTTAAGFWVSRQTLLSSPLQLAEDAQQCQYN